MARNTDRRFRVGSAYGTLRRCCSPKRQNATPLTARRFAADQLPAPRLQRLSQRDIGRHPPGSAQEREHRRQRRNGEEESRPCISGAIMMPPNYLRIMPGWNYTVRLPAEGEILDGRWTFTEAAPAP